MDRHRQNISGQILLLDTGHPPVELQASTRLLDNGIWYDKMLAGRAWDGFMIKIQQCYLVVVLEL